MGNETVKLIEQLAHKLGTTTEYLWHVLIKQAPISAITDLLYLIFTIICGIIIYKFHKYFKKERGDDYRSIYDDDEYSLITTAMIVITGLWVVIFIACFFSIDNIINGFLNPEYWSLKQVINTCK